MLENQVTQPKSNGNQSSGSFEGSETKKEVNIYPTLRRVTLGVCILACLGVLLFLLYLNGKSVYEGNF